MYGLELCSVAAGKDRPSLWRGPAGNVNVDVIFDARNIAPVFTQALSSS